MIGVSMPRAILAAVLGLFGSGFSLVTVLYPRPGQLDAVERAALSVGLSLAVNGITGFLLAQSLWGLRLDAFLIATGAYSTWPAMPAWPIGGATCPMPSDRAGHRVLGPVLSWWGRQPSTNRWLTGVLVFVLIAGLGAFYQAAEVPAVDPPMTEFYLTDQSGQLEGLPEQAVAGVPLSVSYGVVNREYMAGTYQVKVMVGDQVIGGVEPFLLEAGEMKYARIGFTLPATADGNTEVRFILYLGDQPYRSLRLSLNVSRQG